LASLALTSGLAAACFVKAFGITFLALPRSENAAVAREVEWTMRIPMALLAVACAVLGLAPGLILAPLAATAFDLTGARPDLRFNWNAVVANDGFGWVAPLWLGLGIVALIAAIPLILGFIGAEKGRRFYETWGCGRALQTARFEYTATAFANPFKRVFALLYRPVKDLEIESHPDSRYFVRAMTYRNEGRLVLEETLYRPIVAFIQRLAREARIIQSGNVHSYLMYILIALVILLIIAV
jgi:hydrogenase-4 component B